MQFYAGSVHTAKAVMHNPTSAPFDYQGILFMGVDQSAMALVNFHLEPGESKEVSFSIAMPTELGEYPVYIGVYSDDTFLEPLRQGENVTIIAELGPEFYMPSEMGIVVTNGEIIGQYFRGVFTCPITNYGPIAGTHQYTFVGYFRGEEHLRRVKTLTLEPGETFIWEHNQLFRGGEYAATLTGDWEENNYAYGIITTQMMIDAKA